VVWYTLTVVSEELTASIIRMMNKLSAEGGASFPLIILFCIPSLLPPSPIGPARALPCPNPPQPFRACVVYITMMMEAMSFSETSVNIYEITLWYILEESG
jgi:hypothetical protein